MEKLTNITFTGLDARTDMSALEQIQKEYPIAEFGVLMSKHYDHNGNRYPDPKLVEHFVGHNLSLSAHLCGGLAKMAYMGCLEPVTGIYPAFEHPDFKRTQLNVSPYDQIYMTAARMKSKTDKEIIIQQKSPTLMYSQSFREFMKMNPELNVTMLVDPSGGRGIDEGLDLIATDEKIGYAGGINENNVEEKLRTLMEMDTIKKFWIDMESGVRTDDWFDLGKVVRILEKCQNIVKEY